MSKAPSVKTSHPCFQLNIVVFKVFEILIRCTAHAHYHKGKRMSVSNLN